MEYLVTTTRVVYTNRLIWLLSGFGKRNRFVQFFGFLGLLFKLTSMTRNVYSVELVEDFNLVKKHVIYIIFRTHLSQKKYSTEFL